jgi:ubiquinone/menaquinone biosynthesis C-methylase UbiE
MQTDLQRARSFDNVASQYDAIRPSYPAALIEQIVSSANLNPQSRILEIGAGTGKATESFVALGFRPTCVEPGENLASVLRKKFAHIPLEVVQSTFESYPAEPESFDAVIAAQSAHWINSEARIALPHRLLKHGGSIAYFWNMSPRVSTPFFDEVHRLYDSIAGGIREPSCVDLLADQLVLPEGEELCRSKLYRDVVVHWYSWTACYTTDEFIALIDTYSNHQLLEASKKE